MLVFTKKKSKVSDGTTQLTDIIMTHELPTIYRNVQSGRKPHIIETKCDNIYDRRFFYANDFDILKYHLLRMKYVRGLNA